MRNVWIHIHIPKCGGSTFRAILRKNHGPGLLETNYLLNTYQYSPDQIVNILDHHPTCTCLSGHKLSAHLPYDSQDYRINAISFVRDPVDRFISHYFYHRHHKNNWVPEAKSMEFDEYIDWALVNGHQPMYINGQIRFLCGDDTERGLGVIDILVNENGLMLFPISQFSEGLVVLKKLYPSGFGNIFYDRKNVSRKDQPVTENQRQRILEFCKLDSILVEKSKELLDDYKERTFSDDNQYRAAIHVLDKDSRERELRMRSFSMKLVRKGAYIFRQAAGILDKMSDR